MQRRFPRAALAAFALTIAPVALAAQEMGGLGVAFGASVPVSDFGSTRQLGYHALVTLNMQPPASPVGLRVDGQFNEFERENSSLRTRVYGVTGNIVINMATDAASPYLIGGGGWYRVTNEQSIGGPDERDEFGFNIGGGIRLPLSGFSTFVEARVHKVMDNRATFVPITFGVVF